MLRFKENAKKKKKALSRTNPYNNYPRAIPLPFHQWVPKSSLHHLQDDPVTLIDTTMTIIRVPGLDLL